MTDSIAQFPAPWTLNGQGYVFLFKADPDWLMENGFIPEDMKSSYIPSIGTVMFVSYENSSAGPYDELLFIPGKFQFEQGPRYMITKIYVSTMESVVNGQNNWGIPKELADFSINEISPQEKQFHVSVDGETIVDCHLRNGVMSFPITTAIVPRRFKTVVQRWGDNWIHTSPSAKGSSRFASLQSGTYNPAYFPDLNQVKIITGVKTQPFQMCFPVPDLHPL